VLPEENGDQVRSFLDRHRDFQLMPFGDSWRTAIGPTVPRSADGAVDTLLLTPRDHGTDGFFIAILSKRK
jgi:16S rRNA (cytosine967-C5)-methyltransferase